MRKRPSDKSRTTLLYLLFESFPEQANLKGLKNSSDSLPVPAPVRGAAAGRAGGNRLSDGQRRARTDRERRAAPRRSAQTQQAERRESAQEGFGPPKAVRPADDVRQRCAAAGRAAESRGRQTAPHDRIRTGTHDAGHGCEGGANRTAAPGHRRLRPARPHRAAHDDRRHHRPSRSRPNSAETQARCRKSAAPADGRPDRPEKRPNDRFRLLAAQF